MTRAEWDAICLRCGRCCWERIVDADGNTLKVGKPCPWLDTTTGQCKVYDRRLQVRPDCVRFWPAMVQRVNWLPEGCAYRQFQTQKVGCYVIKP